MDARTGIPCHQVLQVYKRLAPVLKLLRERQRCTETLRSNFGDTTEPDTMERVCIPATGADLLRGFGTCMQCVERFTYARLGNLL